MVRRNGRKEAFMLTLCVYRCLFHFNHSSGERRYVTEFFFAVSASSTNRFIKENFY